MALEEEFGFEIPDSEADKIDCIKVAVDFIASHPQAKWAFILFPFVRRKKQATSLFWSNNKFKLWYQNHRLSLMIWFKQFALWISNALSTNLSCFEVNKHFRHLVGYVFRSFEDVSYLVLQYELCMSIFAHIFLIVHPYFGPLKRWIVYQTNTLIWRKQMLEVWERERIILS